MATLNSALDIVTGALQADQSALNIVANNVANANTPGYTRQVPNWQENTPVQLNGIVAGTGVTETGATSVRDRVLEQRLYQQQQAASASSSRLAALNSVQALFPPDSGASSATAGDIGSDITKFFNSFSSLEANPTDNSLREQVLSTADTLAGDISNAAASLNQQKTSLDQEAAGLPSQVNGLTAAIAQLNMQIQSTSPNADAGTLEDERQQDLSRLSQLIGINQITTENNGISLTTTSGEMLVSEGASYPITTGTLNGVTHFFLGTADITSSLTSGGGELAGYLTTRDQDIPAVLAGLDQLAYGISIAVNTQNEKGLDFSGTAGTAIFNPPGVAVNPPAAPEGTALGMSVVMTDPALIAAAKTGAGSGDNANATALAALASTGNVAGMTPSSYYANFVTKLGATVSNVGAENAAQNAAVTQLQTMNDALSSVNLNDEPR